MAVDIGIPIGGILQIQGASTAPLNFAPLDGQVLNEPRSPMHNRTLPLWNIVSEIVPYQITPYDGSVVTSSSSYNYQIKEENLPAIEMKSQRKFTISAGSEVTTAAHTKTVVSGYETLMPSNIVMAEGATVYTEVGESLAGTERRHIIINDAAETARWDTDHKHYYSLQHTGSTYGASNHSIVVADPTDTTVGNNAFGIYCSGGTPTLNTNGSASPTSVSFTKKRDVIKSKWYMRVY